MLQPLHGSAGKIYGKTFWTDDLHLLPYDGIADWDYNVKRLKRSKKLFSPTGVPEALGMAPKAEFDAMRERGVQPWAGASVCDEASVDLAIANGAELITCKKRNYINTTPFLLSSLFLISKMERYICKILFFSTTHSTAI